MQGTQSAAAPAVEADAEKTIQMITPALDPIRYKGQAGKCFHACPVCMIV